MDTLINVIREMKYQNEGSFSQLQSAVRDLIDFASQPNTGNAFAYRNDLRILSDKLNRPNLKSSGFERIRKDILKALSGMWIL
jgi:hypothetical protein